MTTATDVRIDKISEIKIDFSTYQNMVGLPSKFHEGNVPKQSKQEIRHRAGGAAVKTLL